MIYLGIGCIIYSLFIPGKRKRMLRIGVILIVVGLAVASIVDYNN
jgi:hypothetical protein